MMTFGHSGEEPGAHGPAVLPQPRRPTAKLAARHYLVAPVRSLSGIIVRDRIACTRVRSCTGKEGEAAWWQVRMPVLTSQQPRSQKCYQGESERSCQSF